MDNLMDSPGGGYILPDGTAVALADVEGTHKALAALFDDDRDALVKSLCVFAMEIHEAGLPGMVEDYIECALAAGGSADATSLELLGLGMSLERADDLQTAAMAYGRAMHLPEREEFTWYYLHNNLGYCLGQLGRFDEALPHCLAAVRINPGKHNAYKNLGIALQGLGRIDEAAGCYRHACILNYDDDRARRHLADLLFDGRVNDVPRLLAREFPFRIARSFLMEITDDKECCATEANIPMNDFGEMHRVLAGHFGASTDCICMALGMIVWYCTTHEMPFDREAAADLISVAGSKEDGALALVRLADNLARSGYPELALEIFARAGEFLPTMDHFLQIRYHDRLGCLFLLLGRLQEAGPHFREAIRLDPWSATTRRGLGVSMLAQGDVVEAQREIFVADTLSTKPPLRLPESTL